MKYTYLLSIFIFDDGYRESTTFLILTEKEEKSRLNIIGFS